MLVIVPAQKNRNVDESEMALQLFESRANGSGRE
jgi:hypothetical protein